MNEEIKKLDEILSRRLKEEYDRHSQAVKDVWDKYLKNVERIKNSSSCQNE